MNQISLPIDPSIITWLITGGGFLSALIVIWKVGNQIQDKLSRFDERIKKLEENTLLVAWRNYQIAAAKNMFDPDVKLKSWEDFKKNSLQKQGEDNK